MNDFSHLVVDFFVEPVHNVRKSAEEGRPIYDDVEMCRIRIAGDPKSVLVAPANSGSAVRDPQTNERLTYAQLHFGPYEAFKRNEAYVGSGTPLSELPFLTASKRKELQGMNIQTAEALASLDGANLNRLGMGARELKAQAESFISKASGSAEVNKLASENANLKARIEALENMMAPASSQRAVAVEPDISASPFYGWDAETIRTWIVEQGGENPHHKCSHATLVAKADELNAALAQQKAA
jgi:hypothetical protein